MVRSRVIQESHINELVNDYSNAGNIVNYQDQLHVYEGGDESTEIITQRQAQSSQLLPVLTPIKYNEYHSNIVGDIINEESEKSDCESGEHELHKTPSKLPHKKRIAKKAYNQQEQFSIIIPEETDIRNLHISAVSCNVY